MAKIFMIGFQFKGVSYASNVFCQERQNNAIYHLKMVNQLPSLFKGTLILERRDGEFRINSPSNFDNSDLIPVLVDALKKQEVSEP